MRSADEAMRHGLQLVSGTALPRTKFARALAGDIAKGATEGAEAGPAGVQRDLRDRQVRVAEQSAGLLDSPGEQVSMRRHAERFLERPREMRLGRAANLGKARNRPRLVRGGIHLVPGAKEPPQKQRVLPLFASLGLGIGHSWQRKCPSFADE